jgi:putative PIN family toxin of toxin-antitoxin system
MKKHKTVFDTNIWISYFINGKLTEIVTMILHNEVVLYRSPELTKELLDVLHRPKFKKYFPLGIEQYILFYENLTEFYKTIAVFKNCSDPKDNYLFDLAYQTSSKYLVSGDRHVLSTPVHFSLKLLSLTDFKSLLS